MKLVLTGFDPFGPHERNPSGETVAALAEEAARRAWRIVDTLLLSTCFEAGAAPVLDRLSRNADADCYVMLGLGGRSHPMRLERFALNVMDSALPDNAAVLRNGERIREDGPTARETALDLAPLRDRLRTRGFECVISNHAGTYVCNDLYYRVLDHIARESLTAQALFVHIPESYDPAETGDGARPATTRDHVDRLTTVLDGLAERFALTGGTPVDPAAGRIVPSPSRGPAETQQETSERGWS